MKCGRAKGIGEIRFLREQDGVPEREFKEAVVPVMQGLVQRAYLARVEYVGRNANAEAVALCLRATGAEESLAKMIGAVFAPMFGANQHLDIVFLDRDQQRELEQVCHPFFESVA